VATRRRRATTGARCVSCCAACTRFAATAIRCAARVRCASRCWLRYAHYRLLGLAGGRAFALPTCFFGGGGLACRCLLLPLQPTHCSRGLLHCCMAGLKFRLGVLTDVVQTRNTRVARRCAAARDTRWRLRARKTARPAPRTDLCLVLRPGRGGGRGRKATAFSHLLPCNLTDGCCLAQCAGGRTV